MRKALIVGINAYPQNPRTGSVNDAYDFRDTLTSQGFQCSMLLDASATKVNILNSLQTMVSQSSACDVLVFVRCGHGSRKYESYGDETTDHYDEVFCPVDFFSGKYILDDELRAIYNTIPSGVILEDFADCCYAGSSARSKSDLVALSVPSFKTKRHGTMNKAIQLISGLKFSSFDACKENQLAYEGTINGIRRGVFSYFMCKAIRENINLSRANIMDLVATNVSNVISSQVPILECTSTMSTRPLFQ